MASLEEYQPGTQFPGVIGNTIEDSSPAWPAPKRAAEGAPNVLMFVLDDVGFGQLSAFGGLCETPTLDRLAAQGLRYTNFQTTALCSPTRGSLLTGRNHHTLGLSAITELSMGYPAHNGIIGPEHGFLPEALVEQGYNTFAIGKWHLTPPEEGTPAGPFRRWPLGRGFERYYGFLGGDTDQWHPDLTEDNHSVAQPSSPEEGYHLNIDLADKAIGFIKDANNNAPRSPSSSTTRPVPAMRPTMSSPSGSSPTAAASTMGGTPIGRRYSNGRSRWASSRREPSSRAMIRMSPSGARSPTISGGCMPVRWRPTPRF